MRRKWIPVTRVLVLCAFLLSSMSWVSSVAQEPAPINLDATPVVEVTPTPETSGTGQDATPPPSKSTGRVNAPTDAMALAVPANEAVAFSYIELSSDGNWIYFGLYLVDPANVPESGSTVTFTFDPTLLELDETPQSIQAWGQSEGNWNSYEVGVVEVDNAAGVVTFTLDGFLEEVTYDSWLGVSSIPTTYSVQGCDPSGGPYVVETPEITFNTSTGQTFTSYAISGAICNAAPATKSGEWTEDNEGNPTITWTVDTGDVFNGSWVYDRNVTGNHFFDCDSLIISPQGDTSVEYTQCNPWGVSIELAAGESGIARATFTVVSVLEETPSSSYVNCVDVQRRLPQVEVLMAETQAGLGGGACYELFPAGGGDFLTKEVSAEELNPGDPIQYTITATTSADQWSSISLTDVIPVGVDVDSVSCSVEPAVFMSDPCYQLDGSTLTASAFASWEQPSAPVTISIVIDGTVVAEPGTEIVNEACSIRERPIEVPTLADTSSGDPTIIGGGEICASVSTLVTDPVVPSPSPSPSPSPTSTVPVVTPSPTVSPTETPDPTLPPTETPGPTSIPTETPGPTLPPTETPGPTDVPTETPSPTGEATVTPTGPATETPTPGSTTTPSSDPTSTVSGLPSTGSGSRFDAQLVGMAVAATAVLLMLGAFATRRQRDA